MSESSAADGLWLHALSDPLTNCKSTTNLMRFADINVDGDVCLAVCDLERNLKIYKGTSLVSVHSLLDTPTALCVAYIDKATPRTPTLAVAGGSYVFIYRHLRPYRKWTCPKVTVPAEEAAVWEGLKTGELTQQSACTKLDEHRMAGINLTSRSAELLGMPDSKRPEYVRSMKDADYQQHTLITCMEALKVDSSESDGMCCLVVGTENRELYILPSDPANSMVMCKVDLPAVPVLLNASGLLDVEWRVAIICRDQKLYSVKNGDAKGQAVLSGISIDLDAQGVSMTQQDNLLWVATTNRKITCYTTRGKVQRVIVVPSDVVDLSTITIRHSSKCHLLLVALSNGEVCLYKDGGLVHMFAVEKPITGIRFGQYGREDNTLCIVHGKGALTIKIWKRTNKVDLLKADSGPPREQDVPIPVPKKTRLYVEQLQREKEQGADIHHLFHRDLCRLRLETARASVPVRTDEDPASACPARPPDVGPSQAALRLVNAGPCQRGGGLQHPSSSPRRLLVLSTENTVPTLPDVSQRSWTEGHVCTACQMTTFLKHGMPRQIPCADSLTRLLPPPSFLFNRRAHTMSSAAPATSRCRCW